MPSLTRLTSMLAAPLAPPRDWLEVAISALAPPSCCACREPVGSAADPLCSACRGAIPWLRGSLCARCGLPEPCGRRCPARCGAVERAWAPVAHDGVARAVVHAYKLRGALRLATVMSAQIAAGAPAGLLAPPAALVPVPTHPARSRRRGYDHAARLADALGERVRLPVVRCLTRRGAATRQAGASRAARTAAGRVDVVADGDVPRSVVLVDDVHTTGATLEACAHALREGGALRVSAVTYARALR